MPPKHVLSEYLGEDLVKTLSQLLGHFDVPCVLWGDYLLIIYGVPSIIGGIEFVVPDSKLALANAVLRDTDLLPCPDPSACLISNASSQSPPPAFHLHIAGLDDVVVSIRSHSNTLSFMPPPARIAREYHLEGAQSLRTDDGDIGGLDGDDYILVTADTVPSWEDGGGREVFSDSEGIPVLIPTAHRLLEAYIRLAVKHQEKHELFFMGMITRFQEYIEPGGSVDISRLSEPCRMFWAGIKANEKPVRELLGDVQSALEA